MSAKAQAFEHYSLPEAFGGSAEEMAYAGRGDSPVADLHRYLARYFSVAGPTSELVFERLPADELIVHGFSRMAGIVSLLVGYVVSGYLISAFF